MSHRISEHAGSRVACSMTRVVGRKVEKVIWHHKCRGISFFYWVFGFEKHRNLLGLAQVAYRAALLQLHPDKAATAPRAPPSHTNLGDSIELGGGGTPARALNSGSAQLLAVQTAWEVLADPHRRLSYDRLLAAENAQKNVRGLPPLPQSFDETECICAQSCAMSQDSKWLVRNSSPHKCVELDAQTLYRLDHCT